MNENVLLKETRRTNNELCSRRFLVVLVIFFFLVCKGKKLIDGSLFYKKEVL